MSLNIINLTGIISKPGYIPAGVQPPKGRAMNFPRFSALVKIADDTIQITGKTYPLSEQSFWLDITCPQSAGRPDERRISALISKIENGSPYLLLVNGTFSQYESQTGPKYSIKAAFGDVWVDTKPYLQSNKVIISGSVSKVGPNFLVVEERYNTKQGWRSRLIPVYLERPSGAMQGKCCVVYGRLACKTYEGNRSLYIIADEVV